MSGCVSRLPNSVANFVTATYFKVSALRKVGLRGCHCSSKLVQHDKMKVKILPALSDNYMYLIVDEGTGEAAIVDPVAPDTVVEAAKEENATLTTVLTTHHHWDHAGGNKKLLEMVPGLTVVGGDERIDGLNKKVADGNKFSIGDLNVHCYTTPCHTTGHVCYMVTDGGATQAVFTGDTLFLGGCGRFFEGNAEQMHEALNNKLANLPDETKVYCGHEYSIQNLAFGLHVEPDNAAIKDKLAWCKEMRAKNPAEPTIPSTIGEEKEINPFMRVHTASVRSHAGTDTDVDTMRFIRTEKDSFKAK